MKKFLSAKRVVLLSSVILGLVALAVMLPGVLNADVPSGITNADSALGARWQAMSDFYAANSERATGARWQAMADLYAASGKLDLATERSNNAMAARWQAMADSYAAASERATGARWQAMADYYAAQAR